MNFKNINWKSVFNVSLYIVTVVSLLYIAFTFNERYDKQKDATFEQTRQKEMYIDSLNGALADVRMLSTYRTLSESMHNRDIAVKNLMAVGSVAYTKNDSSRVIIADRIIGGGQYDYYVKYKILFKDNHTEEVAPELIFKK